MNVETQRAGPLFDGRIEAAVAAAERDVEKSVATLGASMVRTQLNTVLKKQTPIYRFKVVAEPTPPGWTIHDQGMIYGPWLEGTGSRNRTTRFKGYKTFRKIVQKLNSGIATSEGYRVVARYIGRMN